jgi:hypothetical protein
MTAYMRALLRYLSGGASTSMTCRRSYRGLRWRHTGAAAGVGGRGHRLEMCAKKVTLSRVRRAIDGIETTTPPGIRGRTMMLVLAPSGRHNRFTPGRARDATENRRARAA